MSWDLLGPRISLRGTDLPTCRLDAFCPRPAVLSALFSATRLGLRLFQGTVHTFPQNLFGSRQLQQLLLRLSHRTGQVLLTWRDLAGSHCTLEHSCWSPLALTQGTCSLPTRSRNARRQ